MANSTDLNNLTLSTVVTDADLLALCEHLLVQLHGLTWSPRMPRRAGRTRQCGVLTPLYGSWDRLCSLVVEGCRGALG